MEPEVAWRRGTAGLAEEDFLKTGFGKLHINFRNFAPV
jgi:hypothetical protein